MEIPSGCSLEQDLDLSWGFTFLLPRLSNCELGQDHFPFLASADSGSLVQGVDRAVKCL